MSESSTGLLTAMLNVQAEAPTLKKTAQNPHYKSKFAPLDEIVETMTPLLYKHGLVWTTLPGRDVDGSPVLTYRLAHAATGEVLEGTMPLLLSKQDAQGQGSAITYARRYALTAVLNLVADDDDDGARAATASSRAQGAPDLATAAQKKFLRSLITQNSLDATTMDTLLASVGFERGEGEKVNDALNLLTRDQCSSLIEFMKDGPVKTGGLDVPAPPSGEFEHPAEPDNRVFETGPA